MKDDDDKKIIREVVNKEAAFFCYVFEHLEKKPDQTFSFHGRDITEETRGYLEARFKMMEEFSKLELKQIDLVREIMKGVER